MSIRTDDIDIMGLNNTVPLTAELPAGDYVFRKNAYPNDDEWVAPPRTVNLPDHPEADGQYQLNVASDVASWVVP
jgi:hypothetical protein